MIMIMVLEMLMMLIIKRLLNSDRLEMMMTIMLKVLIMLMIKLY